MTKTTPIGYPAPQYLQSGRVRNVEAVAHLASMSNLTILNLTRTPIPPLGIEALKRALPRAKIQTTDHPRADG